MQEALEPATARPSVTEGGRSSAPSLGMRGGLGKTLLIAFLLLAIIPLALLAFLTYNQIQRETSQSLLAALESTAGLKEAHLVDWVESYRRELGLMAGTLDVGKDPASRLTEIQATDATIVGLALMDMVSGELIASTIPAELIDKLEPLAMDERTLTISPATEAGAPPHLAVSHDWDGRRLVGLLRWEDLQQIVVEPERPEQAISTYLVSGNGLMISPAGLTPLSPVEMEAYADLLAGRNGSGAYVNPGGTPVFGAYRWSPDLQMTLLAEQAQTRAFAAGNTLTAVVVGGTLAVALITAAIAAIVTRRITQPIVQLTETAAWMARGDLNQRVAIARRDEIGVLARAFNRMAADLRVLYSDLEAKVAERTQQLEQANERTRHHAVQLALSAEVARVISSIRDMEDLLTGVAQLIGNAFELHHVSIYLLDASGQWIEWRAGSNGSPTCARREPVGGDSLVGQVASDGQRRVVHTPGRHVAGNMVIPLRSSKRLLGVLELQSTRADSFDENDQMVYQSLANQISVAIENTLAYEVERETVRRLKELDRIQAQFLANMSHTLRTPLTSIIGFSQVILKEIDGPLTELQRTDLTTILESGRQLLGLLNDMLELSQLELGTAPFAPSDTDLAEIVEGVMATAQALARGKAVKLHYEVPGDLPTLNTDGQRVRQVILALMSNAVKFTEKGSIVLRVTRDGDLVTISVSDSGVVFSPAEQEMLFADTSQDDDSPGFGLAISKRVVERLGGQIWVDCGEGRGSTFTFTLPMSTGNDPAQGGQETA